MGRWDCFSAGNETFRDSSQRLPSVPRNTLQRRLQQYLRLAIFFIPLLCQWAAISHRPAVHLTRLGTLNKPWERFTWANFWRGALLDMLSVR